MTTFSLSPNQIALLDSWTKEQDAAAVQKQKVNLPDVPLDLLENFWDSGYPYSGATGGNLTYSFAPTSLGVIVTVHHSHTDQTIDLTEYDNW